MSMNEILGIIKKSAVEASEASQPVKVLIGEVTSEAPLEIQIDQKITLTQEFLILCREVTEHTIEMTVDHITEEPDKPMTDKMAGGGGDAAFTSHNHAHKHKHPYKGRKSFLVHKNLLVGEKVLLLAVQGGQKFVVVDRVSGV